MKKTIILIILTLAISLFCLETDAVNQSSSAEIVEFPISPVLIDSVIATPITSAPITATNDTLKQEVVVEKPKSKPSAIEKTMQRMGIKGIKDKGMIKSTDTFRLSFGKILGTIIILMLVGFVIKVVSGILNTISERKDNWRLLIKRIIPIFRIGSWTFAIYFVIQVVIAPPIETLFAVITSAGVAVGFASQDILKSIFSGIMILFDRPFQVGDKIDVGGYYGEVTNIGLRSVRIVTPDDNVVTVPNSEITSKLVSNANFGENNCQVVSKVYLPRDADLDVAGKIGYMAAAVSKFVYLKKSISVVFVNEMFEDKSMIVMNIKAYVYDIRAEFKLKSDITKRTIKELHKAGILTKEISRYHLHDSNIK